MKTPQKPYLLFGYRYYYPNGGWSDFIGSYATIGSTFKDIKSSLKGNAWERTEYGEVVDVRTMKIVVEWALDNETDQYKLMPDENNRDAVKACKRFKQPPLKIKEKPVEKVLTPGLLQVGTFSIGPDGQSMAPNLAMKLPLNTNTP